MNKSAIKSLKNISAEHLSGIEIYCKNCDKILRINTKIHTETGSFTRLLSIAKSCGKGDVMLLTQEGLERFDRHIKEHLWGEDLYEKRIGAVSLTMEFGETIAKSVKHGTKLILATGGGMICDLAKIVASKLLLPLCFVPSAPTTDGILSPFSVVGVENEMVRTKAPDFVVCDAEFCKDIPPKLVRAGFGDVVSNYLSVFDWMVAKDFFDVGFSDEVAFLAISAADKAVFAAEAYQINPVRGIELLFDALLLSSGAMALLEKLTPCCGGEHAVAVALSKLENKPRMHGEGVFLCFCKLLEVYLLFFSNFSTGKYLPPDTTARCDFLISQFGISEEKAESMCKPPITEDEYKIMREKYRICRERYQPSVQKLAMKMPELKSLFFKIYSDDLETFDIADDKTFSRALGISPDIQDKQTALTLMREFGLLDAPLFE